MKFFLHNPLLVRIVNDTHDFTCTPERFHVLEPEYPGLSGGMVLRYWTCERTYLGDGERQYPNDHDCGQYCDRVATYTAYPAIYAHVSLSQPALCVNADPQDTILFDVHLKPSLDPEDDDLPVTQDWIIRLSHEDGLKFDGFHAPFVNGACSRLYTYSYGLPLGDWYVDETLFDLVEVGGTVYQVHLAQPVTYTLYRELL